MGLSSFLRAKARPFQPLILPILSRVSPHSDAKESQDAYSKSWPQGILKDDVHGYLDADYTGTTPSGQCDLSAVRARDSDTALRCTTTVMDANSKGLTSRWMLRTTEPPNAMLRPSMKSFKMSLLPNFLPVFDGEF